MTAADDEFASPSRPALSLRETVRDPADGDTITSAPGATEGVSRPAKNVASFFRPEQG
jgi:hypothetical protein